MPTSLLLVALALVHIIWGGGFIVLKLVQDSFTIEQILLGRVLFASVIYLLIWSRIPKPQYKKGDWKTLILLALCEPFLLFTFETLGLQYTSAAQGGMIIACNPLTVAIGAYLVYKEKISKRCLIGIICAIAGVVIVSANGSANEFGSNPILGNFFIFCAVLSGTCYALSVKHLADRYHFLFLSAIQVFSATILFLPGAISSPLPESISWSALGALLYLGIGITFCVYLAINYALTRIKAAHVILFANLIPVSTLVLAFLILGEQLTPIQYTGAALVLAGVLYSGMPESSETAAPKEEQPAKA
ncbi:DMT family transporter [Desulfobaculum bizertense]|uniref:DMT family transporter n=1 Tax=Desulfobaculum bizertense TaxID=376490 RepID=UPI001F31F37F|nr:DMT family transporter [Desulfobaculum bizertense]UIJ38324.1 DMT family transporter [Desulfobaculum bizertense]